mgnify:CR=1 FL=1
MPLRETIQELLVRLGVEAGKVPADMKRFETVVTKHLKRTEKPLERQRKAFDKLGKAIKSLAAIWAGSKIVNEIKGLVTVVTDADDRIGKLSNRLGVAVRDLSAFTTGARLAGIGTTAAATGLQRFLRRRGSRHRYETRRRLRKSRPTKRAGPRAARGALQRHLRSIGRRRASQTTFHAFRHRGRRPCTHPESRRRRLPEGD